MIQERSKRFRAVIRSLTAERLTEVEQVAQRQALRVKEIGQGQRLSREEVLNVIRQNPAMLLTHREWCKAARVRPFFDEMGFPQ